MIFENKEIQRAVQFATTAHSCQFRKENEGGIQIPYIVHPLDVMRQVFDFGIHEPKHKSLLMAAILHDVIEDTDYTYGTLLDMFGETVANVVKELTFRDRLVLDGETSKEYQQAKSQHLADFQSKSLDALIVKIADRICNVRDFQKTDPSYAKKYFDRASGLWASLLARESEIKQVFGEHVYTTINASIDRLVKQFNLW